MKTHNRFSLLLLSVLLTVAAIGCDQNAFDPAADIPDGDIGGFVEFDDRDTLSITGTESAEAEVTIPQATVGGMLIDFSVAGSATEGVDYTITETSEIDTLNLEDNEFIDTVRVDPNDPDNIIDLGEIDPDDIVDTLETGIVRIIERNYEIEEYTTTFDPANLTGTIEIISPSLVNSLGDGIIQVDALNNTAQTGPVEVVVTLDNATAIDDPATEEDESLLTVQVGRIGPDGGTRTFNTKVVRINPPPTP